MGLVGGVTQQGEAGAGGAGVWEGHRPSRARTEDGSSSTKSWLRGPAWPQPLCAPTVEPLASRGGEGGPWQHVGSPSAQMREEGLRPSPPGALSLDSALPTKFFRTSTHFPRCSANITVIQGNNSHQDRYGVCSPDVHCLVSGVKPMGPCWLLSPPTVWLSPSHFMVLNWACS